MKLTKENVYVNLQGKTKEELTDLWEFLDNAGEKQYRDTINNFLDNYDGWIAYEFTDDVWQFSSSRSLSGKNEVTIDQLKQIIKPMETKFTPIAMKCTKEQFEAIKPKLEGLNIILISDFCYSEYLVNKLGGSENIISNVTFDSRSDYSRTVYEEWNEEIFLKACGIEVNSLEQQLQKAEAELRRLKEAIEEENKPKVGDWVFVKEINMFYKRSIEYASYKNEKKITNPELIKLLEQEIK